MATKDDLLALERKFWTGDAGFYRQNLDESCLVAFTTMSGVMGKEEIAATIAEGRRWRDLELVPKGFLEPVSGVAILTYEARATRDGGEPYAALVSTAYVARGGAWKMAFHQQTPLADAKKDG